MTTIIESARDYEDWLREQLQGEAVEKDLEKKREKMRKSAFVFLRATYWRWAETILDICPDLADGTQVLAIGDLHVENFGTWRDVDGRLAWGINDFDEAAQMPYGLDLVRLAASAILGRDGASISDAEICKAIIEGYVGGLAAPRPFVLDRDHLWLRKLVEVPNPERVEFWDDIDKLKSKAKAAPPLYKTALGAAMPERDLETITARRSAGAGSLGRPRWVGIAEWRGAPLVREAKAVVMSAWNRTHRPEDTALRVAEVLAGPHRATDPWHRLDGWLVVRRLSPNNRKIEAETHQEGLLTPDMMQAMGFELANSHCGRSGLAADIAADLEKRKAGWLAADARLAAEATTREFLEWKAA